MALITEKDVQSLQNKKSDAETTIKATRDAYDKASNELKNVSDAKDETITEQRGLNPNNLEALNSLIVEFESKLEIPKSVFKEFDPTGITQWGELVYEIIDVDFVESNEDEWDTKRAQRDKELKQRSDGFDEAQRARQKEIVEGISDADEKSAFEKSFEKLEEVYTAAFKATEEEILATSPKLKTDEILTKWIVDEVDNSPIIKLLEEQRAIRKNHAKITLRNSKRITPLIKNVNTGLDEELQDFVDDSEIFVKDIEEELGFDSEAKTVTNKVIESLKDSNDIFTASKAFDLTRDSLFNLEIAGINKIIKEACGRGKTSVSFSQKDITAMQIIALSRSGYRITHDEKGMPGMIPDEMVIIVDWGFAAETS